MGTKLNTYKTLFGNLKGRDHFGNAGIYGRIILNWILKPGCKLWSGLM
jgi:hypothetical protein